MAEKNIEGGRDLGKRRKWRTGFFPLRVVDGLRTRSADHGNEFEYSNGEMARLSPAVV